jgi:hypothetical protein
MLNLLLVLIDCLYNLINLLCRHEFDFLRILWDFLVGYNHFLLHPIFLVLLIFCLELSLLENQFQRVSTFLFLLQFHCICVCTIIYLLCNVDLQFIQGLGWYLCQYQLYLSEVIYRCLPHDFIHA